MKRYRTCLILRQIWKLQFQGRDLCLFYEPEIYTKEIQSGHKPPFSLTVKLPDYLSPDLGWPDDHQNGRYQERRQWGEGGGEGDLQQRGCLQVRPDVDRDGGDGRERLLPAVLPLHGVLEEAHSGKLLFKPNWKKNIHLHLGILFQYYRVTIHNWKNLLTRVIRGVGDIVIFAEVAWVRI